MTATQVAARTSIGARWPDVGPLTVAVVRWNDDEEGEGLEIGEPAVGVKGRWPDLSTDEARVLACLLVRAAEVLGLSSRLGPSSTSSRWSTRPSTA